MEDQVTVLLKDRASGRYTFSTPGRHTDSLMASYSQSNTDCYLHVDTSWPVWEIRPNAGKIQVFDKSRTELVEGVDYTVKSDTVKLETSYSPDPREIYINYYQAAARHVVPRSQLDLLFDRPIHDQSTTDWCNTRLSAGLSPFPKRTPKWRT